MTRTINDGSTLKIEYVDILKLEITEDVEKYRVGYLSKDRALDAFRRANKLPFSNLDIKFSDNIWDFSSTTTLPISRSDLIFHFNEKSAYVDILKMYVLSGIIRKTAKIRTLHKKCSTIVRCLNSFESDGYMNFATIPKSVIKRHFEQYEKKVSYTTLCSTKKELLRFIEFYERTFEDIRDKSIKKYLEDINRERIKKTTEANKRPEVPLAYFPILIAGVKSIMEDERNPKEDRIIAASIILYTQIGFRTAELLTVKADSVQEVWSPNKNTKLYYMEFKSFKHGYGEDGSTVGRTYINALAYNAYKVLITLCEPYRKKFNTDALFVTQFQNAPCYDPHSYLKAYKMFFARHWKELQCLNIGDKYPGLKSFEVSSLFRTDKKGYYYYNMESEWAKPLKSTDRIYYPEIRQFRVSVCTKLYRENVPIHYIRKHMNHLSEDMTDYYIRPKKNLEREFSENMYHSILEDGAKLLGQNGDAFVQKINEFIKANNLNIHDNMYEVVKAVAKKYPLMSKVGGMCIRCGGVVPCNSATATDEIFCAFGMCPNHCHMFFMADISYEEYLRHLEIIKYNQDNGFVRAHQKEVNKLKYVVKNSLMPELTELEKELQKRGEAEILNKYPQLTHIVNNLKTIMQEVSKWM